MGKRAQNSRIVKSLAVFALSSSFILGSLGQQMHLMLDVGLTKSNFKLIL